MSKDTTTNDETDQAPILGSWKKLYWLVLIIHACLITAFFFLTKYYE